MACNLILAILITSTTIIDWIVRQDSTIQIITVLFSISV